MQEITVSTSNLTYSVKIGRLDKIIHKGKVLVVSNPKIAGMYLQDLLDCIQADEVFVSIVPDGESHKNFESIDKILEVAFESRLDRKSLMIALGGGVISDMVGFASGIYQRGVDFITIPTTLLAQVDASVGGKTGINNRFGKNLVGIFHQPKAVYVNPLYLQTLPKREFSAGVAEIIKMAVCFDKDFFNWLKDNDLNDRDCLEIAIARSIQIKANVVSLDETEQGIRGALNYGHTFAHVIENETNYHTFLHGEAVAIGMRMANDLALKLGLMSVENIKSIDFLLNRYDLNHNYHIKDVESFYDKFFLDKKTQNDKIKFIFPKGIGDVAITDEVPKDKLFETLKKWGK
ncbi:3-dehydroquinate synthase [Helicobacter cappadocius]|uniref:3-dehydroquinate synthase n=1 Tax=Helicobacter cappadocius TaxID=3063998 RepID=A0AA90PXZ1_9HELI|nr:MULTISPECIES: 3-dehydroquinate synthase [unclassified Helicobacter]MDO7252710.1 3-dehydroquinate synthase [Helicobacter sp. faydin-H75]MDP2538578.1 3-dehydroquinate synthase [Helicobacter sp. faydin-H76]